MIVLPLVARSVLAGIVALEGATTLRRLQLRARAYQRAVARSRSLGLPLVVIGCPDTGVATRVSPVYGCGDLTVDLAACRSCPRAVQLDLSTQHIPLADHSAVVFESCVLEYVPDAQAAWAEIVRIARSPVDIFTARVEPHSIAAAWYPGARWMIRHGDPGLITTQPVTTAQKVTHAAAGVALSLASLP